MYWKNKMPLYLYNHHNQQLIFHTSTNDNEKMPICKHKETNIKEKFKDLKMLEDEEEEE